MAAYAALVSLMNTTELIHNHPHLSTSLDKNQIEYLREEVGFLLDFIELYNSHGVSKEVEDLEREIASAAHAAEVAIESHVVDQILTGSTQNIWRFLLDLPRKIIEGRSGPPRVMLDLQKGIVEIYSIMEKATHVARKMAQQPRYSTPAGFSMPVTIAKTTVVGFDDYLVRLMDTLTGQQCHRQVIPIVGMGGIGKTTLARNAFDNPLIMQYFDILAWVTISQKYSVREILLQLLPTQAESMERFSSLSQNQLGVELHKHLWGRRYLIVLDDIWGIEAWDKIKFSFPDNRNGSRIVLTSRLTEVGLHFGSSYLRINFLDDDQSWKLFCEKAFGQEGCPVELEDVGKKIAKNCKGLPLSIVVIGGFLLKSNKSQEFWEGVAKHANSNLNSEGEEQCLDILSLSYSHLPAHLKPCFLYTGAFLDDEGVRVSRLIKLWVAEGFLKSNETQSLEEVAEGYIKDLVDRNLILVTRWGSSGKIKSCNIHDLLRDLCLKVAKKEKFLSVVKLFDVSRAINRERRIVILESMSYPFPNALESSLAHSLICKGHHQRFNVVDENVENGGFQEGDLMCVNLRCLDRRYVGHLDSRIASSDDLLHLYIPRQISLLWNLQTISIKGCDARIVAPSEIWEVPQLRNLKADRLHLPDPSDSVDHPLVLRNLQTLGRVENFKFSDEVCKRIPNIKKLQIMYDDEDLLLQNEASSYYFPRNLTRFHKLESLDLSFKWPDWRDFLRNITLPSSLQKLTLFRACLDWKDLSIIGSLHHLEVLKLDSDSLVGVKWNPVEGEFRRLKFLKIHGGHLKRFNADNSHFPVLEKLVLGFMLHLDAIPSGIGDIPTLRYISLYNCSLSAATSAAKILQEQESFGNEDLQVEVVFHSAIQEKVERFREIVEEEGFTSNNLHIKCDCH